MRKEWMEKDYYATLGVAKDASDKDIKKAYRKLARESHPDSNPGDAAAESRFKEINEAYDTLGNEETRREYDHAREMGYFVGGPQGSQQYVRVEDLFGSGFGGSGQDIFSGIQDIFGGRARQPRPAKGADVSGSVTLSFHEALAGTTKEFNTPTGTVRVKIPKGVADGTTVKASGKGSPGANGGPAGDFLVTVRVGQHPVFGRKGKKNLTITVPISFTEAALGAVITVPTLDGTTKIKVPPGTESGTTLRISGKGVETSTGTGDMLVTLEIEVPRELTDSERSAIEALKDAQSDRNPRSRLGV